LRQFAPYPTPAAGDCYHAFVKASRVAGLVILILIIVALAYAYYPPFRLIGWPKIVRSARPDVLYFK